MSTLAGRNTKQGTLSSSDIWSLNQDDIHKETTETSCCSCDCCDCY